MQNPNYIEARGQVFQTNRRAKRTREMGQGWDLKKYYKPGRGFYKPIDDKNIWNTMNYTKRVELDKPETTRWGTTRTHTYETHFVTGDSLKKYKINRIAKKYSKKY